MKDYTIKAGRHRPCTIIPACLHNISRVSANQTIAKTVTFTSSCRYRLDGADQHDWNKLFGFCYGIDGIHKNSARLVWRYNIAKDRIEIASYCYVEGTRCVTRLASLRLNIPIKMEIVRHGSMVSFYIDDEFYDLEERFPKNRLLTFGCGLYFGGNRTAPQDITIKMRKEE